jgi:hypothetical protein
MGNFKHAILTLTVKIESLNTQLQMNLKGERTELKKQEILRLSALITEHETSIIILKNQ